MSSQSVDFSYAENLLEVKAQRRKEKLMTSAEIHTKMVENYKQTKEEIERLKAKKEAIERQIENLERKQANRKKYHEQFKK
jgi:hypothetical protein